MSTQWERVKDIFEAAVALPHEERSGYVAAACGAEESLRSEVERLLAGHDQVGSFLEASPSVPHDSEPTEAARDDIQLGQTLSHYRIEARLGQGGMATVYRAMDLQLRRPVAIKVLKRGHLNGVDPDGRTMREAWAASALNHVNVAHIYEVGEVGGVPFIAMEYIEGTPLDVRIGGHPLPLRELVGIGIQVAEALSEAHTRGIVHRDIKPANILVTPGLRVKVVDFGLAKLTQVENGPDTSELATQALSTPGLVIGTVRYMSPEQALGRPVDQRTDLFSLGAVLYEMATGQPRFAGATPTEIIDQILHGPAEPASRSNPATPRELDAIIGKCLERERDQRYQTADELLEDLRPLHNAQDAVRSGFKLGHFWRRRPRMVRAGSLAILGLVAAWLAWRAIWPHFADGPPPKSLAVVQIENLTHDSSLDWLDSTLCELLTTDLTSANTIQVISAERVRELIGRRSKNDEHLPAVQSRDVAKEAHADVFLTGSLTKLGSHVWLDLLVSDTVTGRVRFHGKVPEDSQSVFAMADQAASQILTKLAPGKPVPAFHITAALTANPEALRFYEEGLRQKTHFHARETREAFQRAIELDPDFVLAHYHLADSIAFDGNVPEARRIVARAVQLAENSPLPRLQKLLTQALQFRLDLKLNEAAKVLETAHRDFPNETEPLFQLARIRAAEARFPEAARLYEEIIRMDPRHALAHDQLGYQYAFMGDLKRAITSIDRYAALLPSGDVVPFCSRGDAYLISERYDEALAQYRAIHYGQQAAETAIHAGDYELAASILERIGRKNVGWYLASGNLAVSRGQLDRAVPDYEQASLLSTQSPLRPWFVLLTMSRILLEDGRAQDLLALGRRDKTPWAAGLRGTAHLLLHQEPAAEREFAALRDSVAPILGDYVADQVVEFHRMQAAFHAGRFDLVIQMWARLPPSFWNLYALDVGRAYLKCGIFAEAEHHLRLAWKGQLAFFWNSDMQAQHNSLTSMLAQFYLGQVLDKTGRSDHAIGNYQAFLQHFVHSSSELPQIAIARAAAGRVQFSERGKLLFNDNFAGRAHEAGWADDKGTWVVAGGAAQGMARLGGAAALRLPLNFHNAIFEFSFRLDDAAHIGLRFHTDAGEIGGLTLGPSGMTLMAAKPDTPSNLKPDELSQLDTVIDRARWHTVVIDVLGPRMIAQLDGRQIIAGLSSRLDLPKTGFRVVVLDGTASFNYLRVYEVTAR